MNEAPATEEAPEEKDAMEDHSLAHSLAESSNHAWQQRQAKRSRCIIMHLGFLQVFQVSAADTSLSEFKGLRVQGFRMF